MQVANANVILNTMHSVPVRGITPAEARILSVLHSPEAGREAIKDVVVTGEVDRTAKEELARLEPKYGAAEVRLSKTQKHAVPVIAGLYPGDNPQLPQTFAEMGYVVKETAPTPSEPPQPPRRPQRRAEAPTE